MKKNIKGKIISGIMAVAMCMNMTPSFVNAEEASQEEYKYVMMNIPYGDFYASEGLTQNSYYDVVSTATTSKFLGTTGLAKGTYNDGKDILGVTYPVAVTADDYNELKSSEKTENDSYYFVDYEGTPKAYKTLDYDNNTYKFSKANGEEISSEGLSVDNYTMNSSYGDYQIDIVGVKTENTVTIGDNVGVTVAGAVIEFSDGTSYGMGTMENLWWGNRVENLEIAWSTPEGKQLKNHGGALFKQFETNGKTLTNVKLITDIGIYNIGCNLTLGTFYNGTGSFNAEITDATTLSVSVPDELKDVTVSVSYKEGRTTVYVAENQSIVNGKVILKDLPVTETTYTVNINSSNYAVKQLSVVYGEPVTDTGITADQKEKLESLIATGSELVSNDATLTILASHIQEAQELLQNNAATKNEADELIGELEELIESAKSDSQPTTSEKEPVKNGAVYTVGKLKYKVTKAGADGTVTVTVSATKNKKLTSATVPATVKIQGISAKVTDIGAGAFKNCTKLKKVTIGTNITSIGKNAFNGDSKITAITIKSKKLKKIDTNAFKGIKKTAIIKVPSGKKSAYKKMAEAAGFKGSVK